MTMIDVFSLLEVSRASGRVSAFAVPFGAHELSLGALLFGGFVAALFLGSFLPGQVLEGVVLADGTRLRYRLNGLRLFVLLSAATAACLLWRPAAIGAVHHHFWPLFAAANVFAFGLALYLTIVGRRREAQRGAPRPGGALAFLSDYFYGAEVNPRLFGLDLKMFSYRPSLMGLGLINVSFAVAQYQMHGAVSTRMWLYQAFYFAYLVNYFQFEHGMLFTWDVIAERFGWMLVWGDYVLVPFFYSIPGWFLLDRMDPMPVWEIAALVILYLVGFVLFRGANEQKHRFKIDPTTKIWGKPPETIGGKLLASGFWGIGRKLNYTGELCMYFAWTIPCGFDSVVPFLLPLWLVGLFSHRAWRDEQRCKAKYGATWDEYCRRARFRMIPFIY